MGTTVEAVIDGKWIDIPQTARQAQRGGWHNGVGYEISWFSEESKYHLIHQWCKDTWGINSFTWKTFENGVWFYREEDAMLCKLKWS